MFPGLLKTFKKAQEMKTFKTSKQYSGHCSQKSYSCCQVISFQKRVKTLYSKRSCPNMKYNFI